MTREQAIAKGLIRPLGDYDVTRYWFEYPPTLRLDEKTAKANAQQSKRK